MSNMRECVQGEGTCSESEKGEELTEGVQWRGFDPIERVGISAMFICEDLLVTGWG